MIYHDAERISGNSGLLPLVILSELSAIYSALFQLDHDVSPSPTPFGEGEGLTFT